METTSYLVAWKRRLSERTTALEKERNNILLNLPDAIRVFTKEFDVEKIYLFGSLIKGTFDERSDIDIAIEGLSPHLYLKALAFLSDYFRREINLVPLETCSSSLKEVIYTDGRLFYTKQ